jgi:hypothetical protein
MVIKWLLIVMYTSASHWVRKSSHIISPGFFKIHFNIIRPFTYMSSLHFSFSDYCHRFFTVLPNFAPCQTLLCGWNRSPSGTAAWSRHPSSLSGSSPLLMEVQLDTNTQKHIGSIYADAIKIEPTRFLHCNVSCVKLNICDSFKWINQLDAAINYRFIVCRLDTA